VSDTDSDTDFAPVEGVDLETYTRVNKALVESGHRDEGPVLAFVAEQGLDPDTWKTVADTWTERILRSNDVKQRFGHLYLA
jgi:hypothetical protein